MHITCINCYKEITLSEKALFSKSTAVCPNCKKKVKLPNNSTSSKNFLPSGIKKQIDPRHIV